MKQPVKKATKIVAKEVEDKRLLRKAVQAIHMSGKLTLLQKKLINNLIFYAYNNLLTADTHQVSVSELARAVGFDSKNTAFLKNALIGIVKTALEFNLLHNGAEVWQASALLSEAKITEGVLTFGFPTTLRKMFHDPAVYATLNLGIAKLFDSNYAFSLYDNCNRFKNTGSTGYWDIELLKKLLGIDPNYETFKEFKYLNAQVLKPAIQEVNERTDIHLEIEYKKLGKHVIEVRFAVTPNQVVKLIIPDDQLQVELLGRIMDLGIPDKVARGYLSKYPLDYIQGNLDEVELRIKNGKVKNYGAFLKQALDDDYRRIVPVLDQKVAAKKNDEAQRMQKAQDEEEELARLSRQRLADARNKFEGMNKKAQAKAETEFANHISTRNPQVHKSYAKVGINGSKMVSNAFEDWIASEIDAGNFN